MVGTMRGIWLAAAAAAAALLVATAPADARPIDLDGQIQISGGLTVAWHGDPARGCGEAGLCGYRGSVVLRPDYGDYGLTVSGRRVADGFGALSFFEPPIIRVKRQESGGDEAACVDVSSLPVVGVVATNGGVGRVRLRLDASGLFPERCAGPNLSNVLAGLPRRSLSLSRLMRRGAPADFRGRVPFTAGRFSGTVRSTLMLRFARALSSGREVVREPPGQPPRRRIVHLTARYRVARLFGTLSTSFGAIDGESCEELDACGVTGTSMWAVSSSRGSVLIDGYASALRRDHGVRGALAAVRRGGAEVFGYADLERNFGTTTADVSRPNAPACHDTSSVPSPGLEADNSGTRRLTFDLGGEEAFPFASDLVRTGCPGPRQDDIVGNPPFAIWATGSLAVTHVGRPSLTVNTRRSADFEAHGYSGSRTANFTLALRRTSLRASYSRVRRHR
jgi:hypothetical protein